MSIQFKRGTADQRKINTLVLDKGQPFFETDTNKLYMGDGTTALKSLKPIVESSNNEFTGDNVFRGSSSFFNSAYFGSGATFSAVANATFGVKGTGYYLYQTDVTTNNTAQLILGGTTEDNTTTSYKVGTIVNKQATLTLPTTTGTVALTNELAQVITITSTTLTDDQLTAIKSSDLNKISYNGYIYSLYETNGTNRVYTANYLNTGKRLTVDISTKAVTTGSLNSLTSQSHYSAYNYVGAADSASNAATTNGNTYLKLYENGIKRSQFKIVGSGATTVSSDDNGNITISSSGGSGDVTAAGNNTFTGDNTFTGTNKFSILKYSSATNGLELNFNNSTILFKDARHSNYGTTLQANMSVGYGTTNATITLPNKTGTLALTDDCYTYIDKTINNVIATSTTTTFTADEMTQIYNNYGTTVIHLSSLESGASKPVEKFLYSYGKAQDANFFIFISPVYNNYQYVLTVSGSAGATATATITRTSIGNSVGNVTTAGDNTFTGTNKFSKSIQLTSSSDMYIIAPGRYGRSCKLQIGGNGTSNSSDQLYKLPETSNTDITLAAKNIDNEFNTTQSFIVPYTFTANTKQGLVFNHVAQSSGQADGIYYKIGYFVSSNGMSTYCKPSLCFHMPTGSTSKEIVYTLSTSRTAGTYDIATSDDITTKLNSLFTYSNNVLTINI